MSQRFNVQIVNATPYRFTRTSLSSHQMDWEPPKEIEANSFVTFTPVFRIEQTQTYVAPGINIMSEKGMKSIEDRAAATYETTALPGFVFTIEATKGGMSGLPQPPTALPKDAGYGIKLRLTKVPTNIFVFPPPDSAGCSGVGWLAGGTVTVGIGHASGAATSLLPPYPEPHYGLAYDGEISGLRTSVQHWAADWMRRYLPAIGGLKLTELTLPGTHDAGSFRADGVSQPWVQTQYLSFEEQLQQGVRALDLRLMNTGNRTDPIQFCHGSVLTNLTLDQGLAQIAGFLAEHTSELVVLDIHRLEENWPLETVQLLARRIQETFGSKIAPREDRTATLNELLGRGYQIVIGIGNYTEAGLDRTALAWLTDTTVFWIDAVQQHWVGASATTWGNVSGYMTAQLARVYDPKDHLWALMCQYNDIPELGTPANLPREISNFFAGMHGLQANIVHADWWNRLNVYSTGMAEGEFPNFSSLINAVPLNLLKGYRKANNLSLFWPHAPLAIANSGLAAFPLLQNQGGTEPTRIYYQDTGGKIGEFADRLPEPNAWSVTPLTERTNTPVPAPATALAGFAGNGLDPRLYSLDPDGAVIELAWGNGKWTGGRLPGANGAAKAAPGSSLTCFGLEGKDSRVYHLNADGKVVEWAWGDGNWNGAPIQPTNTAPAAAAGSALASFETTRHEPRVYYFDDNGHTIELAWGGKWSSSNIASPSNAPAALRGSPLTGFAIDRDNLRLYYFSATGDLIELAWGNKNGWTHGNLSTRVPAPRSRPGSALSGLTLPFGATQRNTEQQVVAVGSAPRVYYFDVNGMVVELAWANGRWNTAAIGIASGAPPAKQGSALSAFAVRTYDLSAIGSRNPAIMIEDRVTYIDNSDSVIVLARTDGRWTYTNITKSV